MKTTLYSELQKKMQQSFETRWDPNLELVWRYDKDNGAGDDNLKGTLAIDSIDDEGNKKTVHELYGQAQDLQSLNDWLSELLGYLLETHPVWRVSKVRKK